MSKLLTPHFSLPSGAIITTQDRGVILAAGDTIPADATVGYAPGCIFIQYDATTAITAFLVNVGTKASSNFDPVYPAAQGAALTGADGGTVDGTYGAEEVAVIQNLVTRVDEIEARLVAAGIIAAA